MNTASEVFGRTPRVFNCAQSVAVGCGHPELADELARCGGGRAPGGRCGALHAALMMAPPGKRDDLLASFVGENGSELCRELKTVYRVPCEKCVSFAAELAEKAMS